MRDDFVDDLLGLRRGVFRIKQKRRLVIGDPTPVFHRAAETARQRDLIQLRQRIRHAKVVIVVLKNLCRHFERIAAQFRFAFRCDHTNLRRTASRFDEIKFTGDKDI